LYEDTSTASSKAQRLIMAEPLKILYDGQCSLCRRAMEGLRRLDTKELIVSEDVSDPAFDPARYGLTAEQVRTAMHVVLPDGRVLRAMEAVRAAYCAVGLGWLVAPTAWPGVRWLADVFYRCFARHRLTFSRLLGRKCDSKSCSIHPYR
jgi:predicted DCC family thiol-disulfide oxidoreductase YuxK